MDTSVLITGLRSRLGASAEVVRLMLTGQVRLLLSLSLALEYRDVALRPDHLKASGRTLQETEKLLLQLEAVAEPVEIDQTFRPLSRDPGDDLVLDLAINGLADVIVTNNIRDLRVPAAAYGIPVMAPGEFLVQRMKSGG